MEIIKKVCLYFLTEFCCEEFLLKFNFLHVDCLKAALSKGLGLAIVTGSMLVKVPQILKISNAKSGEGISMLGTALEIFALLANVSYSYLNKFPFSSYGDGLFLLIQTTVIGSLVLHYGGKKQQSLMFFSTIALIFLTISSGVLPMGIVWCLQASNIPLVFSAKMLQAWMNFNSKSTGQLSAITVTMLFMGSTARIFTSIQETGDSLLIISYCAATFANAVLMSQLVHYWSTPKQRNALKKKKNKESKKKN